MKRGEINQRAGAQQSRQDSNEGAGRVSHAQKDWVSKTLVQSLCAQLHSGVVAQVQGQLVFVDDLFFGMIGMDKKECLSYEDDPAFIHRMAACFKDPDAFLHGQTDIAKNNNPSSKEVLELKDGRKLFRECIPVPADNDGHIWLFKHASDQSPRVSAIPSGNTFLENLLDEIPCDLAILSPEGRYEFINSQAVPDPCIRAWMIGKTDGEFCVKVEKDKDLAEYRASALKAAAAGETSEWEEKRHHLGYKLVVTTRYGSNDRQIKQFVLALGLDRLGLHFLGFVFGR